MHRLLISLFVANLALLLVSVLMLPDQVAMHFAAGGAPDAWGSKWLHALLLLLIEVPLFALFASAGRLTAAVPARWLSLPHKDYWLRPENRAELEARFGALMQEFGCALFGLLLVVALLVLDANLREPVRLNEPLFLAAFVAFMLYTLYWLVKLVRRLKPSA